MAEFNKEELLKIAKLSGLSMAENEIDLFTGQIQKVLGFIDQLQTVEITTTTESIRNVNILRADICQPATTETPLDLAPQRQGQYFVVPKILDEK